MPNSVSAISAGSVVAALPPVTASSVANQQLAPSLGQSQTHPLQQCPGGSCSSSDFSSGASSLPADKRQELEEHKKAERENRLMSRLMAEEQAKTARERNLNDNYVRTVDKGTAKVH